MLLGSFLLCAILSFTSKVAHSQIAIIVNKNNPVDELSLDELKSIFLGNDMYFDNDMPIVVCEFEPDKNDFCLKTYKFSAKRMTQHWFKRIFSGAVARPPKSFKSKDSLIDFVSENEQAIGYIAFSEIKSEENTSFKILKIDNKLPGKGGYILARI